jgi:hypothetical protein
MFFRVDFPFDLLWNKKQFQHTLFWSASKSGKLGKTVC